ncbi:MAG: glycosyltransferase [Leptolyngbya sp. SIO4C5]|nr:glycosyltransferase [Leptolyngbya sp. SIO4C5]
MKENTFLSVVVPIAEDGDILEDAVYDIADVVMRNYSNYEIILVDNCSQDHTRSLFEKIRKSIDCIRYVRLSRKFGLEILIACGLEQAIGNIIVVLRPDCDPPALIPEFVRRAEACSGVVVGKRDVFKDRSILYWLAYNFYYSICKLLLERPHIYQSTHFIALTRPSLNALLKIKGTYRYLRVLSMYSESRDKVNTLKYSRISRRRSERHRDALCLLNECVLMITSNSVRPLRLVGAISMIGALTNFIYLLYILTNKAFFDVVPGWAAISFQSSIMFGLILFAFSIISEYMARLLYEVKSSPLYFIQEEVQSNFMVKDRESRNVVYK